ncbi:hypothetical protein F5884DRAFT_877170 [Xylogone sp. PMI_703]|nr:hypothetical protein F5884DRAFT_877170 [Xylogone sp. PMI_703]
MQTTIRSSFFHLHATPRAMKSTRLPKGESDPVTFTCTCPASADGTVLLFYRYYTAPPSLPATYQEQQALDLEALAAWHKVQTTRLNIGGKIRIAKEGFNITVGGTREEINLYIQACLSHWSFAGLDLTTEERQKDFFKPSEGACACAFGGAPASVQIKSEITPMGVTEYLPSTWDKVEALPPAVFHERCKAQSSLLLDVRNYYESRIGYFVDPKTGQPAVRPPIRRFSQFPQFVKRGLFDSLAPKSVRDGEQGGRQILTYCTGGIRCEKGVRWMQENAEMRDNDRIFTLKGGIAAYLTWMDEEIAQGRKAAEESLFRGRNYVFDARGSTSLSSETMDPVSRCHVCGELSDRLSKCRSKGCHLVLVVCSQCEVGSDPRCCENCLDLDASADDATSKGPRPICACEKEREAMLWGSSQPNPQKGKRRKATWKKETPSVQQVDFEAKSLSMLKLEA